MASRLKALLHNNNYHQAVAEYKISFNTMWLLWLKLWVSLTEYSHSLDSWSTSENWDLPLWCLWYYPESSFVNQIPSFEGKWVVLMHKEESSLSLNLNFSQSSVILNRNDFLSQNLFNTIKETWKSGNYIPYTVCINYRAHRPWNIWIKRTLAWPSGNCSTESWFTCHSYSLSRNIPP